MHLHKAVAAFLVLAGCAGPVYEGRYEYDRGWRIAKVLAVGDEATFGTKLKGIEDCRPGLPEDATLVLVRYHWGRGVRLRIALATPETATALAEVYVNSYDCRDPVALLRHQP